MDLKLLDSSTPFHKAKDVAAFANHLGGTLLIGARGAREVDGHLQSYAGLDPAAAGGVRTSYSQAIEQRCQPLPAVDFEEYPDPNDSAKRIAVVNVWPSLLLVHDAAC